MGAALPTLRRQGDRGFEMAYYVSAEKYGRRALAVGPFRTHGAAMRAVRSVKREAQRVCRDVDHFSTAWGTAHHRTSHAPGRLNAALGYPPGWIDA